jgi:hypothetical protein
MIEIEKKAEKLFDKVRSRFETVSLGDEKAQATDDPAAARFFNFNYVSRGGKDFGNVHLNIVDPDKLKVVYGQNLVSDLDSEEQDEWFDFLRNLREFARRNLMTFDARDITRDQLTLKSIKQQSKSDSTYDRDELTMTESVIVESSMYGSRINSYEDRGVVKIRVKHSDFIDPEKRGARARKIEDIYLETPRGERFLMPHKNLHGARAMAQHLACGGQMHDELGEHIVGIMSEMAAMKHFVNGARRRQFEDRETQDMVGSAIRHYEDRKNLLKRLRKSKDYHDYSESYMPENAIEDDVDVDALRERFVKKVYDDRFDEALPYVYRAHKRDRARQENEMAEEFERWAEGIDEDTWAHPDTNEEHQDLDKIMASPFEIGIDAMDAIASLEPIIGDDQLNDDLKDLYSATDDPETDARPAVMKWLKQHNPELAAKYETNMAPPEAPAAPVGQPAPAPEQPQVPNQTTAAPAGAAPMMEDDSLALIRMLAGLSKK